MPKERGQGEIVDVWGTLGSLRTHYDRLNRHCPVQEGGQRRGARSPPTTRRSFASRVKPLRSSRRYLILFARPSRASRNRRS